MLMYGCALPLKQITQNNMSMFHYMLTIVWLSLKTQKQYYDRN
jgi:hypothetical protein